MVVAVLCFTVIATSVSADTRVDEAPHLSVGLNCGSQRFPDARRCRSAGARLARIEFSIASPVASMDRIVALYAKRGIKVQPLAGFHGRLPTSDEARNLRAWALRFGPRGSFWRKKAQKKNRRLAVTAIELGNETSYGWQYGDSPGSESYRERARTYAVRAREAAFALRGTGVGLLVQGDDGGSASSVWIDEVFRTAPDLHEHVLGWTVHPYGPRGSGKIDRLVWQLRGRNVTRSLRVFVTEWGLASDNGRPLSDNYGYPVDLTYEQAAATLRDVFAFWRERYKDILAQVIVYQSADRATPGTSTDRELYFGVLQSNGGHKAQYTAEIRRHLSRARAATVPGVG